MKTWRIAAHAGCWSFLLLAASVAQEPVTVGEVYAGEATVRGSVIVASGGTRLASGSSISAGSNGRAFIRLQRGGEIRVCPNTTVSVTASSSGRDLLFAFGNGAIETEFKVESGADTIMTPDFRILLAGPGTFHLSVSSDAKGNTCVRTLGRNTSAVIVSEVVGDGVYQVKPNQEITFLHGQLSQVSDAPGACGCVSMLEPPRVAEEHPPQTPPAPDNSLHVQVDAGFVYRATDPIPEEGPVVARLRLAAAPVTAMLAGTVRPPVAAPTTSASVPAVSAEVPAPAPHKGFLGKIKSLFSKLFGRSG